MLKGRYFTFGIVTHWDPLHDVGLCPCGQADVIDTGWCPDCTIKRYGTETAA